MLRTAADKSERLNILCGAISICGGVCHIGRGRKYRRGFDRGGERLAGAAGRVNWGRNRWTRSISPVIMSIRAAPCSYSKRKGRWRADQPGRALPGPGRTQTPTSLRVGVHDVRPRRLPQFLIFGDDPGRGAPAAPGWDDSVRDAEATRFAAGPGPGLLCNGANLP